MYINIFLFYFISLSQWAFADDNLCGIGNNINVNSQKEINQQQNDILTNLLNTGTDLISSGINTISGAAESRITDDVVEQLLSIYFTLTTTEVSAQGYTCIPESLYYEVLDNLTNIILEIR